MALQPHNWINAGLIISTLITYILMVAFNGLAGSGAGIPDVFYSTVGDISDKYQLFITPAGITFAIWSIIFIWLALSVLFFVASIFISNSQGRLYLSPPVATPWFTGTLSLNFLLNLSWIFVWDRSSLTTSLTVVASVILFLVAITNVISMVFLARNIANNTQQFAKGSSLFWYGLVYRLILNGLGLYTTWTIIASLINLATALTYYGEVDQKSACLTSLSLLVIIHVSWFVIENFFVDFYARYLLTPYLVVIWAANGIRVKKSADPNVPEVINQFVLAILIIAVITLIVRLAIVVYRIVKKPLAKMTTVSSFNDR